MSNCIGEGCKHPTHSTDPIVAAEAAKVEQAEKRRVLAAERGPIRDGRVHHRARHENRRRKAKRRLQKASRRGNR